MSKKIKKKKTKKYNVQYRGEFEVDVEAKNESEAVEKAVKDGKWDMMNDGHRDMFEAEEIIEANHDYVCQKCGKPATINLQNNWHLFDITPTKRINDLYNSRWTN